MTVTRCVNVKIRRFDVLTAEDNRQLFEKGHPGHVRSDYQNERNKRRHLHFKLATDL
jgi:hypothetical protein